MGAMLDLKTRYAMLILVLAISFQLSHADPVTIAIAPAIGTLIGGWIIGKFTGKKKKTDTATAAAANSGPGAPQQPPVIIVHNNMPQPENNNNVWIAFSIVVVCALIVVALWLLLRYMNKQKTKRQERDIEDNQSVVSEDSDW